VLELYEGKLSRTVLRGGGGSNAASLPDLGLVEIESYCAANAGRTRVPDWARRKRKNDGTVPLYLQSGGYVLV